MNCYYHPDREAIGACVNCGRLICAECKTVLAEKIYCNPCADKLFAGALTPPAQAREKTHYNTALRVISGIFGALFILGAVTGLSYFAESGLVAELVVDLVSIIIAAFLLAMAFVPQWVSTRFKIKLEKGLVFGSVFGALVIVYFVANALGPEPPGGWWNY